MTNQQNFLGPLIAGKVLDTVIGQVLKRVAASPNLSLEDKDVGAVKQVVAEAVREELKARQDHVTNSEPVYQSRVVQGSALAFLTACATIYDLWFDGLPNSPEDFVIPAMTVVGTLWALYGRLVASKPFWR